MIECFAVLKGSSKDGRCASNHCIQPFSTWTYISCYSIPSQIYVLIVLRYEYLRRRLIRSVWHLALPLSNEDLLSSADTRQHQVFSFLLSICGIIKLMAQSNSPPKHSQLQAKKRKVRENLSESGYRRHAKRLLEAQVAMASERQYSA